MSAQKKEWLAKKAKAENQRLDEIKKQIELQANSKDNALEQMKAMNLPEETVIKVQEKIESEARKNVRQIQGDTVYETVD